MTHKTDGQWTGNCAPHADSRLVRYNPFCSRRSMDRTSVCGTGNVGSIPTENTKQAQNDANSVIFCYVL